jgi:CRP/FNR family transcriptional regulator, cyclic AMP receptor protein
MFILASFLQFVFRRINLMKIKDLSTYSSDEIQALMRRIPFFRELQQHKEGQLERLLSYSCIVELAPGELIMRRGDRGSWLYFLIKGRLDVYIDGTNGVKPLNQITPGELFGDLALLCEHQRKANVAAIEGSKKVLLFATDFKPFGAIDDFSRIDLNTKLIFYRTMVHSIRWRLEVSRMGSPAHPLTAELRQVPTYKGAKGIKAELDSLYQQAQLLASILDRWNNQGENLEDVVVASVEVNQPGG